MSGLTRGREILACRRYGRRRLPVKCYSIVMFNLERRVFGRADMQESRAPETSYERR